VFLSIGFDFSAVSVPVDEREAIVTIAGFASRSRTPD
jgi:hypothetical protein